MKTEITGANTIDAPNADTASGAVALKDNSNRKIVVAVLLLLIALATGTYAFLDFSQHKLSTMNGEGGISVRLVETFDPATSQNWTTSTDLTKVDYVTIDDGSANAYVRVRALEWMGFGQDYPYTDKRLIVGTNGKYLTLDGNLTASAALTAAQGDATITKALGRTATAADLYWYMPKFTDNASQTVANVTQYGAWYILSEGKPAAGNYTPANGILGAFMQYKQFGAAAVGGKAPVASEKTSIEDAAKTGTSSPLISGCELEIDSTNQTVNGGGQCATTAQNDIPGGASDADQLAVKAGYTPFVYTAASANSKKFRTYVMPSQQAPSIILYTDWVAGKFAADLCVDRLQSGDAGFAAGDNTNGGSGTYQCGASGKKDKAAVNAWIFDDVTVAKADTNIEAVAGGDGWFYWGVPLTSPQKNTTHLQDSLKLIKQPSESFRYSQYVSMQVVDATDAGNWKIPSELNDFWFGPKIRTLSTGDKNFSNKITSYSAGDLVISDAELSMVFDAANAGQINVGAQACKSSGVGFIANGGPNNSNLLGCTLPEQSGPGTYDVLVDGTKVGEVVYDDTPVSTTLTANIKALKTSMSQGQVKIIADARCKANGGNADCGDVNGLGEGKYRVKKMPDGKVWMIDNLAYDPTIDFGAGNIQNLTGGSSPLSTTLPSFYDLTSNDSSYGYLYNWCAAMMDKSLDCRSSYSTASGNWANGDISPNGFFVPVGGPGGPGGDFADLVDAMLQEGKINPVYNDTDDFANVDEHSPWNGVLAGSYSNSALFMTGQISFYWSRTVDPNGSTSPKTISYDAFTLGFANGMIMSLQSQREVETYSIRSYID